MLMCWTFVCCHVSNAAAIKWQTCALARKCNAIVTHTDTHGQKHTPDHSSSSRSLHWDASKQHAIQIETLSNGARMSTRNVNVATWCRKSTSADVLVWREVHLTCVYILDALQRRSALKCCCCMLHRCSVASDAYISITNNKSRMQHVLMHAVITTSPHRTAPLSMQPCQRAWSRKAAIQRPFRSLIVHSMLGRTDTGCGLGSVQQNL